MNITTRLFLSTALSIICSITFAQDDATVDAPPLEAEPLPAIESIIVTGSLVPKGDFVSKAPIATISSDQFEMTNAVNVESLINSMPQVVGGADRSSTWGAGIATANLRGLGENRTLVLVNSRRFVPTFPDGGTVDLNFIPVGLIDRVEVLTGGASAAYGSDALAGVINFILKEDFDGWEINGGMEQSEMGDAQITNFNITNGGSFASGNGSFMFHFDRLERDPVMFTERDISRFQLVDTSQYGPVQLVPNPASLPLTPNASHFSLDLTADNPFASINIYTFTNDGDQRRFCGPGDTVRDGVCVDLEEGTLDNVNALQYLQLPQERNSFVGKIDYDFGGMEVYGEVYYSKSEVPQAWPGPTTLFPSAPRFTMTVEGNPFLQPLTQIELNLLYGFAAVQTEWTDNNGNGMADTVKPIWMGRVFSNDLGASHNERSFESVQFQLGVKGDLGPSFTYEVYAQLGEVESLSSAGPLINTLHYQESLLVTPDGQCDGEAAMALGIEPSPDCVPANIYSDDIGQEAASFIAYPAGAGSSVTVNEQNVVMATISGNTAGWFSLPGDPGPIGIAVGMEYLEIKSKIVTPEFLENQEFLGFAFAPFSLDASIDSTSVFGEALIPLVSGKNGIEFLELELGWRISEHSNTGRSNTYKAALSYYPVEEFQIRGSYNKAVRSPSIDELYRDNRIFANGYWDPCFFEGGLNPGGQNAPGWALVGGLTAGLTLPEAYTDVIIPVDQNLEDICLYQGVPAENFQDIDLAQWSTFLNYGGDPNLDSEDATTMSIGFVWTPFDYDLSLSVDFFSVEIENYIETAPLLLHEVMQACFVNSTPRNADTVPGFSPLSAYPEIPSIATDRGGIGSRACDAITRDEDGIISSIFLGYQNLGLHELQGWDFNVSYGTDLFNGYLDINYFATKIKKRTIVDNAYGKINWSCLGEFNGKCDSIIDYPVPDFKHRMTAGWSMDNLELQIVWKHIASLNDGNNDMEYFTETIDSYSLVDASVRYTLDDAWMITAGIKNVFDKQPQPIGSNSPEASDAEQFGQTNTLPQFYDVFGRTFFLKLTSYF